MRLENSFQVAAPLDRAWALLNDVPRVVPCMPGAELTETVDANTWKGLVHVKLGPVALRFATDVTREVEDAAAHRVVLSTKARELRGRGGAEARIESTLTGAAGATQVDIATDLTLQGAVAQYGRGIVPDVAAQLTRQFAENVAALLDGEAPAAVDVEAIGGLGLGLRALWTKLAGLFRKRR